MTPRSLRVMAVVRWCMLALVTALAATTMWRFWGAAGPGHGHTEHGLYYCPMHPQIRSPRPGECPICHMTLEPVPADRSAGAPGASGLASGPASTLASAPGAAHPPEVTAVELTPERQRLAGVVTHTVTRSSVPGQLRVPGVVTAPETGLAQVRARAAGFVERVAVRQTGVRVARGQVLAWIYSPEIYRAQEELLAAARWRRRSAARWTCSPSATSRARASSRRPVARWRPTTLMSRPRWACACWRPVS